MNNPINLEKTVLDLVYSGDYQPLKLRGIAKRLKLLDEEKNLKRVIKRLIKQDRLAYGSHHVIIKPKSQISNPKSQISNPKSQISNPKSQISNPKSQISNSTQTTANAASTRQPQSTSDRSNEIIGTFRRAAAGFGFVTPKDSTANDRSDDIFIPKQKTLDAADLDLVRIRVSRDHQGRRREGSKSISGRVVDVIDRHTNRFVGTYGENGGYGFVVVDGGVFESGILVGDAGAKNGKAGDKVVIEMVHFPSDRVDGEAVIVEILGDRGKPGVDTLSIIRQFDLPEEFPESVLENARQQAEAFDDSAVPAGRTDFTTTTVVTIDPKTARDFDDAISLKRLENGHWQLGVHIADVSHFVPYQSELDNEAYRRATSVYLPDRVIPMLPEIISNNLASLQPNRLRFCMTAVIEFNNAGVPINTELFRGVIKSAHRFTYEDIDEYLADDDPWKEKLSPEVFALVRDMHTLAMRLRTRRMAGGAINLVLPEVKIDLDDDGKVCGAHTVENTESHQVIEEFMLAANEAVATRMADEKLFYMRRVHPQPSEAKLTDLNSFVKGLGIEVENLQSRFEMKRVIEQSEGLPEQHAIHYAVLRSMQKAIYSPEEIGHYALNSDNYCHFTSPIRRYPDLIIHRMVGDLIDGRKPDSNYDRLMMLGKHCSELEKRAAEAERELTKLKLLNFMSDKVGTSLHAIITGIEAFGIFAQGIEIPAEGMLPVASLPHDKYQYDRASRTLSGFKAENQFRLGDAIEVRVAMVDPDRRLLEFELTSVSPRTKNTGATQVPAGSRRSDRSDRQPAESSNIKSPRDHRESKQENRVSKRSDELQTSSRSQSGRGSNPKKSSDDKQTRQPDEWKSTRASGPQSGQRKKRRISDADQTAKSKSKKPKPAKSTSKNPKVESSKSISISRSSPKPSAKPRSSSKPASSAKPAPASKPKSKTDSKSPNKSQTKAKSQSQSKASAKSKSKPRIKPNKPKRS